MKVIRKYNQFRRDCCIEMECENCGENEVYEDAYDDRNFWDNVVPNWKCVKCGKTTNELIEEGKIKKEDVERIPTRYAEGEVV